MRLSKAQKTLKRLHGSPEEFTDAVIAAIGDISKDEALRAIRDYRKQWEVAGETSSRKPKDAPTEYPATE